MQGRPSIIILDLEGALVADLSAYAISPSISNDEHGFASFNCTLEQLYFRSAGKGWLGKILEVGTGDTLWWRGRIEDIDIGGGTVGVSAYGGWAASREIVVNRTFVHSKYSDWEVITEQSYSNARPDRYTIRNNDGIYFAPRKNSVVGGFTYAMMGFALPEYDDGAIIELQFSYQISGTSNYVLQLQPWGGKWSSPGVGVWSQAGPATSTATVPFGNAKYISFTFFNSAASSTYTGESGATFARVTNLKVRCVDNPITAKTVADILIGTDAAADAAVGSGYSPLYSGVSADTGKIEDVDPTMDYTHLQFFDTTLQDALLNVAATGSTTGTPIEVGVYEDNAVYMREQSSNAVTWYVEPEDLSYKESLDDVFNNVAVTYRGANNEKLRTAYASSFDSQANYETTRSIVIKSESADEVAATALRDNFLAAAEAPPPRLRIMLKDRSGRLYSDMRANDYIVIMPWDNRAESNLDTLLIKSVSYNLEDGIVMVVAAHDPEDPFAGSAKEAKEIAERVAKAVHTNERLVESS